MPTNWKDIDTHGRRLSKISKVSLTRFEKFIDVDEDLALKYLDRMLKSEENIIRLLGLKNEK